MKKFKEAGGRIRRDWTVLKWVFLILGIYLLITEITLREICPLVILTGLPCPGCGLTRSSICIWSGHFKEALHYNAMGYLWNLWIVYWGYTRYWKGCKWKRALRYLTGIAVLTVIYYCYRMGTMFPGEEPMNYNTRNLLYWLSVGR